MYTATGKDIAPNCLLVGGGQAGPKYVWCNGCDFNAAMTCLSDMRGNVTGNVPSTCSLNALSVLPQKTCCPDYTNKRLLAGTGAYPDTLQCLKTAGCEHTKLFNDTKAECMFHQCIYAESCVLESGATVPRGAFLAFFTGLFAAVMLAI